jgi:hypothetical protein
MFFGYQEVLYPHWQTKLTSLQELTIGGSLAVVVLDVIRHQLLHDGINLGLLSSGLSFNVLNFLWSPDFLSAFRTKRPLGFKIWLCSVILLCCILVSIVGQASALLCIPIQLWLRSWTN